MVGMGMEGREERDGMGGDRMRTRGEGWRNGLGVLDAGRIRFRMGS